MHRALILCLALCAVTFGVYLQTGEHGFINFDDPGYVSQNPRVQGGLTAENIVWAFSTTAMANWHPLTWLSHMADVELFELSPRAHHLTNVFFHVASTALLFYLLSAITGLLWRSLFVTALFALHPLHVESVAWVAERKDVLSGLFFFLTLLLYARYVRRGGRGRYLLALFSFALGLMAKPMLVTVPMVLLLLDYWPFRRSPRWSLVTEKVPFLVLSALSSAVTLFAQEQGGAVNVFDRVPFLLRLENSAVAVVRYLFKTIWPADLGMLYPFPGSIPVWQAVGAVLLIVLLSAFAVHFRRSHPYLVTGWFWFLITLLPVIGIVQVGGQSMADRYTYLPLTGLFIACAWGIGELSEGWRYRKALLAGATAAIVIVCGALTWRQAGYWRDDITLYRHTLRVTGGNHTVRNNYASALAERGDLQGAITQYRDILGVWPGLARVHNNLGVLLAAQGNEPEAMYHYNEALRLTAGAPSPGGTPEGMFDRATAHFNLGNISLSRGRPGDAIPQYRAALDLRPDFDKAYNNLGIAFASEGKHAEAIAAFRRAARLNPRNLDARTNLAISLRKTGGSGND